MTGLVRKAMLLAVCGLLTAGVAMAHVPDPANSECVNLTPLGSSGAPCIYVGGSAGGVPDNNLRFCVTIRDFQNAPIENSSVVLDFSNCDLQLCINQLDPNAIVDCVSQTVRKLTDVTGKACFKIQGKSKGALGCGGQPANCVRIFADSTPICSIPAPTFDLVNNGPSGVGGGDLAAWLTGFFCLTNPRRCDYINDGAVGGGDLARWLSLFFALGSTDNCGQAKDPNVGPKCP